MKTSWRDAASAVMAVIGAVVVFAKLQSYSWWLIGSWKGAVGVIAVLGIGMLLTNIAEFIKFADIPSFLETLLWLIAGTMAVASLLVTTTRAEFIGTAVLIGAAWLAQVTRHLWRSTHTHGTHYLPVQ